MTLGALIDLGVSVDQIQQGLHSLNLPDLKLRTEEVKKCGFRAVQIHIDHPPEKAHRHLHHIDAMIDEATEINDSAKALAKRSFVRGRSGSQGPWLFASESSLPRGRRDRFHRGHRRRCDRDRCVGCSTCDVIDHSNWDGSDHD